MTYLTDLYKRLSIKLQYLEIRFSLGTESHGLLNHNSHHYCRPSLSDVYLSIESPFPYECVVIGASLYLTNIKPLKFKEPFSARLDTALTLLLQLRGCCRSATPSGSPQLSTAAVVCSGSVVGNTSCELTARRFLWESGGVLKHFHLYDTFDLMNYQLNLNYRK